MNSVLQKFLFVILILSTLLICIFSVATAEEVTIIDSGSCGDNVSWQLDSDSILTISGAGAMKNYTFASAVPWDAYNIKSVVINEGVASICPYAFYDCNNLTSISIPESVTSIGRDAFSGCGQLKNVYAASVESWIKISCVDSISHPLQYADKLYFNGELATDVVIPVGATFIGDYAFLNCSSITSITIPEGVTSIGYKAFYLCNNIISITLPESIVSIGTCAFAYCTKLNTITIPKGVFSIGDSAFNYCTGLTTLTILDDVTSIGSGAFSSCNNLTTVTICDGLTSIGEKAFYNCSRLTNINIPDSVTYVGNSAFYKCSGLRRIDLPEKLTFIGEKAFDTYNGYRILCVYYGSYAHQWCKLNKIEYMFHSAYPLVEPIIDYGNCGDDITWYLDSAGTLLIIGSGDMFEYTSSPPWYSYRSQIKVVDIKEDVASISEGAFYSCADLTSIVIPDSVTSIADSAFDGCPNLVATVVVDSFAYEWCAKNGVRWKCAVHTTVTDAAVSSTCTESGLTEGKHCSVCGEVLTSQEVVPALGHTPSITQQVYEVNVGSEMYVSFTCLCGHNEASLVKWESKNADIAVYTGAPNHADPGMITATFAGMSAGVSTVTADFVDEATEDCVFTIIVHGNKQMILPAMLRTIDEEAFMNAPVHEVILPEGMTVIGERAFANCAELVIIHMPDSIESIADDAFVGCENVTFICASENVAATYAAEHGIPYVIVQ